MTRSVGFIFAAILISSCCLLAQGSHLTGKVIDADSRVPLQGCRISMRPPNLELVTDSTGEFTFSEMRQETYLLTFSRGGYLTIEKPVTIVGDDSLVVPLDPLVFHSAEVVVRSSKGVAVSDKQPVPSFVLDGANIVASDCPTLSDALAREPGIALVRDGIWETGVSVRGMSRNNVVMLLDNTRLETASDIETALSLVNPFDIERVEVVRGANSSLGGSGAFGGIVHCFTKTAEYSDRMQFGGETGVQYGSVNNSRAEYFGLNGETSEVKFRISGERRIADNYSTPLGEVANSQFNDFGISAAAGARVFQNQSLDLTYQRFQAQNTGIPGGSSFSQSAATKYNLARRELYKLEYTIPALSKYVAGIIVRASNQIIERDVEVDQSPALVLTPHATHTTGMIQSEISLTPWEGHFMVFGAELWQRSLDSKRERYNPTVSGLICERPLPVSSFGSAGIYAQDEWTLKSMTVTLGGRYDLIRVHNDLTYDTLYQISAAGVKSVPANQSVLWNASTSRNASWSADAGVRRALTDLFDASILVSSAYRAPSLEERYQYLNNGGTIHAGNPYLKPERSVGLDIGVRMHTSWYTFGVDAYYNSLEDLVTEIPGTFEGSPALVKTNIGRAATYGYESTVDVSIVSALSVKGSVSYVRGEDLRNNSALPQIPPLSASMGIDCAISRVGFVELRCDGTSDKKMTAPGEMTAGGYALFDASFRTAPLDVDGALIALSLGAQNIFNRAYMNFLSTARGVIKLEPGRNVFGNVSVQF